MRATSHTAVACGLAIPSTVELSSVVHDKFVVSRALPGVTLQGPPRLIHDPDDFGPYYLAERGVEPPSLPERLQKLRGAKLRFLRDSTDCRGELGPIRAWAWVDEELPGLRHGARFHNARHAFREGDPFLVADIRTDCKPWGADVASLSSVDDYRSWQVHPLSGEQDKNPAVSDGLIEKGRAALEIEPSLAVQNAQYARYRKTHPQLRAERWWDLPFNYVRWSHAISEQGELLIAELEATVGARAERVTLEWLGVWCVAGDGSLVSVGPPYMPVELGGSITNYQHKLRVIGPPRALPLIFYSYYVLRPETAADAAGSPGRYRYDEFTPPVPRRPE